MLPGWFVVPLQRFNGIKKIERRKRREEGRGERGRGGLPAKIREDTVVDVNVGALATLNQVPKALQDD